ncbi:MAG: peroxiredoxin family protein [Capsulimonadaceae bacterium]
MRTVLATVVVLASVLALSLRGSADAAKTPLLPVGSVAPDFTAKSWAGTDLHLSDYAGKIVVLEFWASWCPTCNEEMPHVEEVYDLYKDDGVVVVGLCVWDKSADETAWVRNHPQYALTFAFDPAGRNPASICNPYHVTGVPTTYVIDKQGNIAAEGCVMAKKDIIAALKQLGARSSDELAAVNTDTIDEDNTVQPDEIVLEGTVKSSVDAKNTLLLSTTQVTTASGATHPFPKPRDKRIVLDSDTSIISDNGPVQPSDLTVGEEVDVTGHDSGTGKTLKARCIKIVPEN